MKLQWNKKKTLKVLKWTGISILGFILLVSVLVYAFKGRIINYVVHEINQHLTAKVTVGKIDVTFWRTFPRVGVDFENVLVLDTNIKRQDTVFYSELVRLKFNAKDLWNKKYVLQEAQIFPGVGRLKVYENGRENYMIFKASKEPSTTPIDIKLEAIKLYQFKLSYVNKITRQSYQTYIKELKFTGNFKDKKFDLKTKANLKILAVKNQGVQLLSNKIAEIDLKLLVNTEPMRVIIPKSTIKIENLPFEIEGLVTNDKMQIEINGKNLKLQDVTNNLLSNYEEVTKYKGKGIVTFHLSILDDMIKESPTWVNCSFKLKNGQLTEPSQNLKLTRINVDGQYSNEKGIGKEFVQLKTFNFESPAGPFEGQFLMSNFSHPRYKGIAKGSIDLKALTYLVKIPYIDSASGKITTNLQFDVLTLNEGYQIDDLNGDLQLLNVWAKLKEYKQPFSSLNGSLVFNKDEAYFEELGVKLGSSNLQMNGEIKNIQNYLSKAGQLNADVEVASDYIDVADLNMEEINPKQQTNVKSYQLPDNIQANLSVFIRKLKYRAHQFDNLKSKLWVGNRKLTFSEMNVENAGNSVQGALSIEEIRPEYFMVDANLNSSGINFKSLFKEWKNFDQNMITEQNINGYAVVGLQFKAPFDWTTGIVKKDIISSVNLKVVNGELKNVSLFKEIVKSVKQSAAKLVISKKQLNLFEQRLMNIKFDELSNNFTIYQSKVNIPDMLIKSSALDIEVNGTHTFSNQIDYHFSFRFRDIKTIDKDSEFGEIEDDGTGLHVFMRMTGTLDNPVISWDKDAKKEQSKINRENAKEDLKSILKSEFGIGKKDSTIRNYQPNNKKNVSFDIDFGDKKEKTTPPKQNDESPLKKSIQEKIKKAKEQKEPEMEFEVE